MLIESLDPMTPVSQTGSECLVCINTHVGKALQERVTRQQIFQGCRKVIKKHDHFERTDRSYLRVNKAHPHTFLRSCDQY